MFGTGLDIHRKLALLLAVALVLAIFLAGSMTHYLAGAWGLERAARTTQD
mgnify:CR=1 FL=1